MGVAFGAAINAVRESQAAKKDGAKAPPGSSESDEPEEQLPRRERGIGAS
jgi:hypothetical protein